MAIHCSIEVFFMNKYNPETFLLFILFFKPIIEVYIKLDLCRPLMFLAQRTRRVIMFGIVDLDGLLMAIKKVFFFKRGGVLLNCTRMYPQKGSKVKGRGSFSFTHVCSAICIHHAMVSAE